MDLLFGPKLKANQIKVMHIDNQVYHLGLESSKRYLDKTKLAVETLWNLYKSGQMEKHENTLLTVFLMVKKFGLRPLLSFGYKLFNKSMTQKLTGKNPSARLFQWFKLMYLCKISYH
jgi:hypothetical protein